MKQSVQEEEDNGQGAVGETKINTGDRRRESSPTRYALTPPHC